MKTINIVVPNFFYEPSTYAGLWIFMSEVGIYFFRTKSGAEIDFVIEKEGKINLFEVKYKKLKKKIDERQLKNFVKKQGNIIAEASVINLSLNLKNDKIQYLDYRVDTQ